MYKKGTTVQSQLDINQSVTITPTPGVHPIRSDITINPETKHDKTP